MGNLGLDETPIKDDNMFQRMFWPSDHAGETDTLGKQGFWVCFTVAVVSFAVLLFQGHWVLAPLVLAFYWLGGMGVREHNQPAAILVAAAYLLDIVGSAFSGHPPGILQVLLTLLMFANVRATWIAAKWAASDDPEAMPERLNSTLGDKLVDQIPAKVWPKAQVPFFALAGIYVLLSVLGTVMYAAGIPERMQAARQPKTQTIEIAPTR